MAEQKLVINDVKTGKNYAKTVTDDTLMGKKLRDKISGDLVGLPGYELEITGGSDNAGFPMRADIDTAGRKKALLTSGPGVHIKRKGQRTRKTIVGNTISETTVQINLKITKYGTKKLEDALGLAKEESPAEETKPEAKEEKPKEEAPKEEAKPEPKEEVKEEKKEKEAPKEEPKKE